MTQESGRVLVVDDDETVRDVVRRYLEVAGFTVEVAGNGEEGLRLFAERAPDLVVLDVMMPGINGLEVCRRLRQISQVPVVLLTALGEEENRIAGLQLGADDYVTKPFSPRELALRVSRCCAGRACRAVPRPPVEELRRRRPRLRTGAREATLGGRRPAADRARVRSAGVLPDPSRHRLLADRSAGEGVGLGLRRPVHSDRPRATVAREDRAEPAKPVRVATVWGVGYRYDPVPSDDRIRPSPSARCSRTRCTSCRSRCVRDAGRGAGRAVLYLLRQGALATNLTVLVLIPMVAR